MSKYTVVKTLHSGHPEYRIFLTSNEVARIEDGWLISLEGKEKAESVFSSDSIDEIYDSIRKEGGCIISPIFPHDTEKYGRKFRKATSGRIMDRRMLKDLFDYSEGLLTLDELAQSSMRSSTMENVLGAAFDDQGKTIPGKNICLHIRANDRTRKAGLKEYVIFGLGECPEMHRTGGTDHAVIKGIDVEVIERLELEGIREMDDFAAKTGKEKISLVSLSPKNSSRHSAFTFNPDGFDRTLTVREAMDHYVYLSDIINSNKMVRNHAVSSKAIYEIAPADGTEFDGSYNVGYDVITLREKGIRILRSCCMDSWLANMKGLLAYSENDRKLSEDMKDAIRRAIIFEFPDGRRIEAEAESMKDAYPGYDELVRIKEINDFGMYVAFQNLDRKQKKALRSWQNTEERNRRHAVAIINADGDNLIGRLRKRMEKLNPEGEEPSFNLQTATETVMTAILKAIDDGGLKDYQMLFLFPPKPSDRWNELDKESLEHPDGVFPARCCEKIFSAITEEEIAVMFLPDTQSGNIDTGKIKAAGFHLLDGDEEQKWLDALRLLHDDLLTENEYLGTVKEEKRKVKTKVEASNPPSRPDDIDPLAWNWNLIASEKATLLGKPLLASPTLTENTIFSVPPESPLTKELDTYGSREKNGWHICIDKGFPISESHSVKFKSIIRNAINVLEELQRLSSKDHADISIGWNGEEHRPFQQEDPIVMAATPEAMGIMGDNGKDESIASLISDGRLKCRLIRRPDLGIGINLITANPDMFSNGLECIADPPDILMMRSIGQNPSRSAFKRIMVDLERFELRMDAVETIEAVLESGVIDAPGLPAIDHPVELTAPKGTIFGLVEDIVLLPNGKKPPKAYISIWSADMKGKYKSVLDKIPKELEKRISVLLMMMRSDEKILEVIEPLPDGRNGKNTAASGGKKSGIRSVKTVSLTREFRHKIMKEKTEHTPVPRPTEGKILTDINVRRHLRYQAYGPGYSKKRLITIESYAKRMFVNPGTQTTRIIK